jgi:hypothetical protein
MSGQFNRCGWAYDHSAVSSVQVTVDGVVGVTADYGQPRPDVAYPGIALMGNASRQFAFGKDRSKSLAGHATCTLKARFTPSFTGAQIVCLNLTRGGGGLRTVKLTGTGT